jgi:hypothetical protein
MKRLCLRLWVYAALVLSLTGVSRAGLVQITMDEPYYCYGYSYVTEPGHVVDERIVVTFGGHTGRNGTISGTIIRAYPYLVDFKNRVTVFITDADLPVRRTVPDGESIELTLEAVQLSELLNSYLLSAWDEIKKDGDIDGLISKFMRR